MVAIEYGVFDLEDCLEQGFSSYRAADLTAARWRVNGNPDVYAAQMCPDHEEQPREGCDICESEE